MRLAFAAIPARARCPLSGYEVTGLIALSPLHDIEAAGVEALLDRAFGADRVARTAYKVRGDRPAVAALSFAAMDGDVLVGSIQCWPVSLAADDGTVADLVMIGPVAVDPLRQRDGIGRMLMTAALDAAHASGLDRAMMLIGDPDYYSRFFGFTAERTARWRLPGPVDRHRLLARGPEVSDAAGALGPRLPTTCPQP